MTAPNIQGLFDLSERVVLITGGSRGLGMTMGRGFAAAGAKVVLSSRKLDACEEAASVIRAEGGDAVAIACHMGEVTQVRSLVESAVEHYGRLDVVGEQRREPRSVSGVTDATEAAWDKSHDANLRGPLFLMQGRPPSPARFPIGQERGIGRRVDHQRAVRSARFYGTPGQIAYGSAKAAPLAPHTFGGERVCTDARARQC